jgi:hypothetical protein
LAVQLTQRLNNCLTIAADDHGHGQTCFPPTDRVVSAAIE